MCVYIIVVDFGIPAKAVGEAIVSGYSGGGWTMDGGGGKKMEVGVEKI